jgi:hypothetical protein
VNKYDRQREALRKPRKPSPMQGHFDRAGDTTGPTTEEIAREKSAEARRLAVARMRSPATERKLP